MITFILNIPNMEASRIAEIVLLDAQGKEVPRTNWKIVYADS